MTLNALEVGYALPGRALVDRATLRLRGGLFHAVVGPNGAGKSTLLRLLAGELAPTAGTIELNGRPLASWSARERARQRAVLPQAHGLAFGFTVQQVVALGRLPCPRHRPEVEAELVEEALALAGARHLLDRRYPTLSGGERARVQLARVLAQVWEPLDGALQGHTRYLLLDEPTASFDLAHQHECLRAVRALADRGLGVLAILHDPNLALRYADEVTLLRDGHVLAQGAAAAALTSENLERLYRIPILVRSDAGGAPPYITVR